MKLFLNTVLKGLTTAFFVILLGGFLYINVAKPEEINLRIVASKVVNQTEPSLSKTETPTQEVTNIEDTESSETIETEEKKEATDTSINESTKTNTNTKTVTKAPEVKEEKEEASSNTSVEEKKADNTVKGQYAPNMAVVNTFSVLETYHGKITGYGPDCVGCSGKTAYGHDARNGNIYYQDKTFGSIRIVAGDKSLPFGTIVKISGLDNDIIAVVLDRGGAVGFDASKHAYFDLLHENESSALAFGQKTATFEILRKGF